MFICLSMSQMHPLNTQVKSYELGVGMCQRHGRPANCYKPVARRREYRGQEEPSGVQWGIPWLSVGQTTPPGWLDWLNMTAVCVCVCVCRLRLPVLCGFALLFTGQSGWCAGYSLPKSFQLLQCDVLRCMFIVCILMQCYCFCIDSQHFDGSVFSDVQLDSDDITLSVQDTHV